MAETMLRSVWAVTPWATVLAALLLALRRPLDGRVPARAFRLGWCLLALRVALPVDVSLPHAPLAAPVPAPVWQPLPQAAVSMPAAPGAESPMAAPSIYQLLAWVWLSGTAAFLLAHLVSYGVYQVRLRRTRRAVQDAVVRAQVQAAFGRAVPVYTVPQLAGPMLAGVLRPALYLPAGIPAGALPYVLAHEARHRRVGDVPLLFLLLAANACQWFNPVFYVMARRARRDIELACDEAVLAGKTVGYRQAYGAAMLDTVRRGRRISVLSTGFSGGGGQMKRRFLAMFDTRKKTGGAPLVCALLMTVLAASALVACTARGESAPQPPASVSTAATGTAAPTPDSESIAPASESAAPAGSGGEAGADSGAPASSSDLPVLTPAQGPVFPVPGYEDQVTVGFGGNGHRGTDIQAPEGTPIYAMAAGEVVEAETESTQSYGKYVKVQCGSDTWYLYAHCSALAVEKGQVVEAGQLLAYVGNTGNTSGNHAHIEVSVDGALQDPAAFWSADPGAAGKTASSLLTGTP